MDPVRLTIVCAPRTKKAHNRTCDIGKRCRLCRRGARTIVLPSESYELYEKAAVPPLRRWYAQREPRRLPCSECEGSGWSKKSDARACGACTMGLRPPPLAGPVSVAAAFYIDADRATDPHALYQGLADVLVVAGVLLDDSNRVIRDWDGSRVYVDRERPRVELVITPIAVEAPVQSELTL